MLLRLHLDERLRSPFLWAEETRLAGQSPKQPSRNINKTCIFPTGLGTVLYDLTGMFTDVSGDFRFSGLHVTSFVGCQALERSLKAMLSQQSDEY